jgi:hypothetical protein
MVKNQPKPTTRTCTDCKLTKPLTEYTSIAHKQGWYGRCRVCRARRARERYWSDPVWREKQEPGLRGIVAGVTPASLRFPS